MRTRRCFTLSHPTRGLGPRRGDGRAERLETIRAPARLPEVVGVQGHLPAGPCRGETLTPRVAKLAELGRSHVDDLKRQSSRVSCIRRLQAWLGRSLPRADWLRNYPEYWTRSLRPPI
jgi:hypothetical protein